MESSLRDNLYFFGIRQTVLAIRRSAREEEKPYLDRVLLELDRFGSGEDFRPFSFALVLTKGRDVQYLDLTSFRDSITLSQGGYVYSAAEYGDIYGDWTFTLWQSGDFSGACRLDPREVCGLLSQGASVEIAF